MEFLKILFNNLRQGPVTDAFPAGEAFTPERFRGKVKVDPNLCMGCGTCIYVCTAGAIKITPIEHDEGFDITVWHNSCCLCGQCRHYCPTKAITLTNDWHNAHRQSQKYLHVFKASVHYDHCISCNAKMRFLPEPVLKRIYADHMEIDVERISKLCPECRRIEFAIAEERACHIDHIQQLAEREEVCIIPALEPEVAAAVSEPSVAVSESSAVAVSEPNAAVSASVSDLQLTKDKETKDEETIKKTLK